MEEYLYSKRYSAEYVYTDRRPALTIYQKRETNFSDEEFVKLAIMLSETCQIGLDVFEREDRLRADFILHTQIIFEEHAHLWDALHSASNCFGIILRSLTPQVAVVTFVRIKTKFLEQEEELYE